MPARRGRPVLKSAAERLPPLLPHTRWGDFLHMLVFFHYAQRRLPRPKARLAASEMRSQVSGSSRL